MRRTAKASGTATVRLVFVGREMEGPATELLDKMIAAMGLPREQARVLVSGPTLESELAELRPEAVVRFGQNLPHPSELIAKPALKKAAWQELQAIARTLGILR
jgi:DNA polymerase III psi subunit